MNNYIFQDIVIGKDGLLKGPFGSDLKYSLYVPKNENTYKVYLQENILSRTLDAGNHYISNEYYNKKMYKYSVKNNDFIVTCDGTLGEIYQLKNIKEEGIISSSLLRITLNPNLVDYDYFYYLFKAKIKKELIRQGNNSVLKHLPSIEIIRKHKISLPDLDTQKKIGSFFKKIDDKIDLNNKIIHELESIAVKIFNYWYLQFDFPNFEGKPYKTTNGKMKWNKELNKEIPITWDVKFADDLGEIKTGKEDANHSCKNGRYPFFTCSNDVLWCNDYTFDGDMVLIAGNGDFNVKHYNGKFNAYQRTYVINLANKENVGLFYLFCKLNINKFKKGSNGSIIKFITLKDIKNIKMLESNDSKLKEPFNIFLKQIEKYKSENQELIKLRDFLLPLLINGKAIISE